MIRLILLRMKLSKSTKNQKNNKDSSANSDRKIFYQAQKSFPNQKSESQLLLKKIESRKRGARSTRVVFRKKHGIIKKVLLLVFAFGLCIFLLLKFNIPDHFKISTITVTGSQGFVNADDVKNLVEKNSIGKYIFFVKEDEISNILLRNFLGAKKIYVKKDYPNSLNVFIEERIPTAVIYDNEGNYFLIDSEGYVLGLIEEGFSNLPEIRYEGPVVVGSFLEKDIVPISLDIIKFADRENLKIYDMRFYSDYVRLYISGDIEVYMGYGKDHDISFRTIKSLLRKSADEGRTIEKIDLRYDKVIVLYD